MNNRRRRGTIVLSRIDIVDRDGQVHSFYCNPNGSLRDRVQATQQAQALRTRLRATANSPAVVDDPQPIPPSTGSLEDVNAPTDRAYSPNDFEMPIVLDDETEGPFQSSIGAPQDLFGENDMPIDLAAGLARPDGVEPHNAFVIGDANPHYQSDPTTSDASECGWPWDEQEF